MRRRLLNDESLAERVTRALAIGFSVTALGLNAWLLLSPKPPLERAAVVVRHDTRHVRSARSLPEPAQRSSMTREVSESDELDALLASASRASEHSEPETRERIARIGGERASRFLVQRLNEASDAELSGIASALAEVSDPSARAALRVAADSPRGTLRSAAVDALATLDSDDVRDFMVTRLNGADASAGIAYFSDCREPRALPALERLAREGASELRRSVLDALFAQGEIAEPAIERLLHADGEVSDAVLDTRPLSFGMRRALRRASIARLGAGAITTGSVFDFLEQDLSNEARDALLAAAQDPASAERALNALATRGDRVSLDALTRLANGPDRGISERAACALLTQPDSRARHFATRVAQRGT